MQRISYEQMLIQSIHDHDIELATSLITRLQKTNALDYLDSAGKSFLSHALEAGEEDIAKSLLELSKNSPEIIFRGDLTGQTCLILAAKRGYVDIVGMIIDLAKDVKANTPGYKIWLKPNNKGATALHAAAGYRKLEVVKLLLEQLSQENKETARNFVNRKNINCNTALHLACFSADLPCDDELIGLLIQHGADLNLTNTDKQTPFHLLCKRSLEEQINLLDILLKNEVQEVFLYCYHKYANENDKDETIKNNYLKLCEKRDITIYQDAMKAEIGSGLIIGEDAIDKSIPDYLLSKKEYLTLPGAAPKDNTVTSAEYQLFQQDDDTLQKLIDDVEAYLAELQKKPAGYISYKTLARLATTTFTLTYIGIEVWQIIMAVNKKNELNNYILSSAIFGSLGGYTALGLNIWTMIANDSLPSFLKITGEVPIKISHDEWVDTITTIRNNIRITLLEKLLFLEEKEKQDRLLPPDEDAVESDYLPTQVKDIRDLEANLAEFENKNKTITEMVDMVTQLDGVLKRIQIGMRQTNKPFSMFYKPADTVVDINEKVEELSDDEHTPIMRGNNQYI